MIEYREIKQGKPHGSFKVYENGVYVGRAFDGKFLHVGPMQLTSKQLNDVEKMQKKLRSDSDICSNPEE